MFIELYVTPATGWGWRHVDVNDWCLSKRLIVRAFGYQVELRYQSS